MTADSDQFRSATTCSGVMSRHEVKNFPVLPDVVMLAFERKQVSCLQRELQGPLERQLQVLDIMLEIFTKDTKAQEAIAESTLDVLIFILRTSNLEDVSSNSDPSGEAADRLKLKVKICQCLELLAKYPNGRKELTRDVMKLEDFRYAVQSTESFEIKMSVRETCKLLASYHPAGADALVQSGYWNWILASIEIDTDPRVRSSSFALLCCLRRQSNSPVPVKPEVIKLLLKQHFTLQYGVDYSLNLLDFCHATCRQHEHKDTFLVNDGLELCFDQFVAGILNQKSSSLSKSEEALCAKAIEFLSTLCVMVEGKQRFKAKADCRKVFYDDRVLSCDHPALYKTAVQLMLMAVEQPDVRAELKGSKVVTALKKLQSDSKVVSDEFQVKILAKCLALLFWEP